jgi:hypothetical protein
VYTLVIPLGDSGLLLRLSPLVKTIHEAMTYAVTIPALLTKSGGQCPLNVMDEYGQIVRGLSVLDIADRN